MSYTDQHSPHTIAQSLPEGHLEFFVNLRNEFSVGEFLCVHAGVRPTRTLDHQLAYDLLWIRDDFILHSHPFPYTVIFGHTLQRDVLLHLPFKIGLDTGLAYGNMLSCLELKEKELFQINQYGNRVSRRNLQEAFTQTWPTPTESRSLHR